MSTTTHYEFGGPFGALMTMLSLPVVICFLYVSCTEQGCVQGANVQDVFTSYGRVPEWDEVFDLKSVGIVMGWMLYNAVLFYIVPGPIIHGTKIEAAGKPYHLRYKINGFRCFWVTMATILPFFDLSFIYDDYLKLAFATVWLSIVLSFYLYATSFKKNAVLAKGGNTGNPIYDFFIGRELNPRIGELFDLKELCELRPGLIGWVLINIGLLQKQIQLEGEASWGMIAVTILQGLYVVDSLYFEKAILTTMDITADGFGFMLAFGDLAWVPFTYTLQARYIVVTGTQAAPSDEFVLGAVVLSLVGYTIFRLSNYEKDQYRTDPTHVSVAKLKTLDTNVKGRKLLISGWWGMARKINYTGDWLQGLGWSFLTGTGSIIPFFYPIYFFILLVHRALRDDESCTRKYGIEIWQQYKKHVPYLFVPYVI